MLSFVVFTVVLIFITLLLIFITLVMFFYLSYLFFIIYQNIFEKYHLIAFVLFYIHHLDRASIRRLPSLFVHLCSAPASCLISALQFHSFTPHHHHRLTTTTTSPLHHHLTTTTSSPPPLHHHLSTYLPSSHRRPSGEWW